MNTTVALVTRYNVRISYAEGRDVNDQDWLDYRRDLFEDWCVPFVRRQSDPADEWFLLVDQDLPDPEERRLRDVSGATILRTESHGHAVGRLRHQLKGRRRVVMARLDSDDSLAPDYVATLRAEADRHTVAPAAALAIRVASGAMHDLVGRQWMVRDYPHGPFAALLEDASEDLPETVLKHAHYDLHRHHVAVTVRSPEPLWCIRLHGSNVANELQGEPSEPVAVFA